MCVGLPVGEDLCRERGGGGDGEEERMGKGWRRVGGRRSSREKKGVKEENEEEEQSEDEEMKEEGKGENLCFIRTVPRSNISLRKPATAASDTRAHTLTHTHGRACEQFFFNF